MDSQTRSIKTRKMAVPKNKMWIQYQQPFLEKKKKFNERKFQIVVDNFKDTNFFTNFKKKLFSTLEILDRSLESDYITPLGRNIKAIPLNDDNQDLDIVCYGLGNFMSCIDSLYQLAFLVILINTLSPKTVGIFDPVFSKEEKRILKHLGMNVLDVNEQGKRTIWNRTIFFMPHCHADLYNNLLSANWHIAGLSKLIVIGNSFQRRVQKSGGRGLGKHIVFASEFVTEIEIETNFKSIQVFNSLYLHYFHMDALHAVPFKIWES